MRALIKPQRRGYDKYGSGAFGASRGARKHNGIDFACLKGSEILSVTDGVITKIGYPYNPKYVNKAHLRYVQVSYGDFDIRYFYVKPTAKVGTVVNEGDVIGVAQGLLDVYPGITDHFHLEVKKGREYLDPNIYLE